MGISSRPRADENPPVDDGWENQGARNGQIRTKLDYCYNNAKDKERRQAVCSEKESRASYCKHLAGSRKESGANGAADCDHLGMARFGLSLCACLLDKFDMLAFWVYFGMRKTGLRLFGFLREDGRVKNKRACLV